jgi:hypothetical protein
MEVAAVLVAVFVAKFLRASLATGFAEFTRPWDTRIHTAAGRRGSAVNWVDGN